MTLGNYITFLRAKNGGVPPQDIAAATGLDRIAIWELEVKHKKLGTDEMLAKLAEFFQVPVDGLTWRRDRYGKKLTVYLWHRVHDGKPASFKLNNGELITGRLRWANMTCVSLMPLDGGPEMIIYRHAIDDWAGADHQADVGGE